MVALSWNRNTSGSDGLLIERAECAPNGLLDGTWVALPVPDPAASSFLDQGASKNLYFTYRITNLKGSLAGQPSAPSDPVFTGLLPVAWVTAAYDPSQGGIQVSWGASTGARPDGVRLERSDCEATGASLGNWTTLSLPTGYQTAFLDKQVTLGARYTYRATSLYGTNTTPPCLLPYSIPIPETALSTKTQAPIQAAPAAQVGTRLPVRLWLENTQGRIALD
jgi:hypothetical protein